MPLLRGLIFLCIGITLSCYTDFFSNCTTAQTCLTQLILICVSIIFNKKYRYYSTAFIALAIIHLGIIGVNQKSIENDIQHFSNHNREGSFCIVTIKTINKKSKTLKCISSVDYIGTTVDSIIPVTGKIMVFLSDSISGNIKPGDQLFLTNKISAVRKNKNPKAFDYKSFLASKNIHHQIFVKESTLIKIKSNEGLVLKCLRFSKNYIHNLISTHVLNLENQAIAKAMLLGNKEDVNEESFLAFSETGAIHILAVSGLHVGIVATFILSFLKPLDRTKKLSFIKYPICILLIWKYAILTGAAPPSLRAAIMFSVFFMAPIFKRQTNTFNSIGAAACIILLYNPLQLFTISFQFSFLALVSILFFYPRIEKLLYFKTKFFRNVWSLIVLSVSAQILLTPLSIFYFHKFPIYFWLTGIIAVPAAGIILGLGLSLVIISTIPYLASIENLLGNLLNFVIDWLNYFIHYMHSLPFGTIKNIWINEHSLIIAYLGLTFLMVGLFKKNKSSLFIAFLILILQCLSHISYKKKLWGNTQLVVYDLYDKSLVDLISGGTQTYLLKQKVEPDDEEWNCKNYRHSCYVNKPSIPIVTENKIPKLIRINDKFILIDPDINLINRSEVSEIDLLLLSKHSENNFKETLPLLNFKKVVIDGSITFKKKEMIAFFKLHNYQWHDTSKDGAFIYNIN